MREDSPEPSKDSDPEVPEIGKRAPRALLCKIERSNRFNRWRKSKRLGFWGWEGGKVTGEERAEAADGEVTVGRGDGGEVGFVVEFGGEITGGGERVERHLEGCFCF